MLFTELALRVLCCCSVQAEYHVSNQALTIQVSASLQKTQIKADFS